MIAVAVVAAVLLLVLLRGGGSASGDTPVGADVGTWTDESARDCNGLQRLLTPRKCAPGAAGGREGPSGDGKTQSAPGRAPGRCGPVEALINPLGCAARGILSQRTGGGAARETAGGGTRACGPLEKIFRPARCRPNGMGAQGMPRTGDYAK